MRVFKSKWFAKFAKNEGIEDATLLEIIKSAELGKIDADYGGGVIKQRIARINAGKSGGYRSIIIYKQGNRAFFVYGFAKSKQENLSRDEEKYYKDAAKIILRYSDEELLKYLSSGVYEEI